MTTEHDCISYVDDVTQVVGNTNKEDLQIYIQELFTLINAYYKSNLLVVNEDKTEFMTVSKNNDEMDIYIHKDDGEIIKSGNHIKILGVTLNNRNSLDTHVSRMASIIGMRFKKISHLLKYMDQKQRKTIMTAKLLSVVAFACPLFSGET